MGKIREAKTQLYRDEIDAEIDAEIAMWQRRRDNWLLWYDRDGGSVCALRGAQACLDKIDELRRQRLVLTGQQERK